MSTQIYCFCISVLVPFIVFCSQRRSWGSIVFSWVSGVWSLSQFQIDWTVIQLSRTHTYMIHLVEACVSTMITWKLLHISYLPLGSCVEWKNISDKFACQGHRSRWWLFFGGFQVTQWAILSLVWRFCLRWLLVFCIFLCVLFLFLLVCLFLFHFC